MKVEKCYNVQTDGQTDRRADGQTDRRTDGQTDGQGFVLEHICVLNFCFSSFDCESGWIYFCRLHLELEEGNVEKKNSPPLPRAQIHNTRQQHTAAAADMLKVITIGT